MEESCLVPTSEHPADHETIKKEYTSFKNISVITYFKLIAMNLLAFGLELCTCAGFSYIPPFMLKNGFTDKSLTVIMGIGPVISLVLVPIIGRWSDNFQSCIGRRRPFMLALGMVMVLSLLMIPYSVEISLLSGFLLPSFILAAGVIILDFSSQAVLNPCKALIPDIVDSIEEQSLGYTTYSCMLSLGGCFGYLITAMNWTNSDIGLYFGGQEKAVFILLAISLLLLLLVNIFIAHEKKSTTPNKFNYFSLNIKSDKHPFKVNVDDELEKNKCINSKIDKSYLGFKMSHATEECEKLTDSIQLQVSSNEEAKKKVIVDKEKSNKFLLCRMKSLCKYFTSLPPVLYQLFIATLFGWMGLMCHNMYYTDFTGQVIFKGNPQANNESDAFNLYNEGIRMGSWGLLFECLFAGIYAGLLQEKLINKFGMRNVYLFGMIAFSFCSFGTVFAKNIYVANTLSGLSGCGSAAITTIPYTLISEYYNKKEVYYHVNYRRGVGEDLAVLDSAMFLSQIIPALFLGFLVEIVGTSAIYMMAAALFGLISCYFSYYITFIT